MQLFFRAVQYFGSVLLILTLGACANTSTVKASQGQFNNKNIEIVPTGTLKIDGQSSNLSGAFGALGVLVEAAITEASRNQTADQANKYYSAQVAFDVASTKINEHFSKIENVKKITASKRSFETQEFSDWFNSDVRSDNLYYSKNGTNILIDFGFQNLAINSYLAGLFAEGAIGVRVIDVETGKVTARARTFGVGAFGGEKIPVNKDNPEYLNAVKTSFDTLIARLTNEAIIKMMTN